MQRRCCRLRSNAGFRKKDIFALYCNEIYLGQRGAVAVRGVKEAAKVFYGKELRDISLSEAATLAGMIQSPAHYSPVRHPEAARSRRDIVLTAMQRKWLDHFRAAGNGNVLTQSLSRLLPIWIIHSRLTLSTYVNRLAESEFETSGNNQRIYTTIDLELQEVAERTLKQQLDRLDDRYANSNVKPQAALVALDPHTGNVLAMVGGRNYAESQLNRATDALRQPGSTFKPFVYAAALEDGMSPVQMFMDAPREFVYDRNKIYRPANYGGGYSMREVTMRTGLVKSLNVVTVDIALQTGLARIANLATRFGLPKPERYPSLALGVEEVTPLQLASAYAAFVNEGRRVEAKAITSVGEPPAAHVMSPARRAGYKSNDRLHDHEHACRRDRSWHRSKSSWRCSRHGDRGKNRNVAEMVGLSDTRPILCVSCGLVLTITSNLV